MTRPVCLSMCLAVAILAGVVSSQENFAGRLELNLYILKMDFTEHPELRNMSSTTYMNLKDAIVEAFSPIGGRLDQLLFSDGSGCVKAYISWQDHNQGMEFGVIETIKTDGLTVNDKTWMVSFNGCESSATADNCPEVPSDTSGACVELCGPEKPCADGLICCSNGCAHTCVKGTTPSQSELLTLTLFLPSMSYDTKTDLADQTSQIYQDMKAMIMEHLSPLGGELDELIFSDGGGCVKVYITWRNGSRLAMMMVLDRIKSDGLVIWGETWPVSFNSCADNTSAPPGEKLLTFKFYVVGLPWVEDMKNHRSGAYMLIKQVVETTFRDLGGNLRTLELAENHNCVEFYVEWNAEATMSIADIMSRLKTSGVQVTGQTFQIRTKPCLPANTCPEVPSGTVGICVEECSAEEPCADGLICCSNGCGHTCVSGTVAPPTSNLLTFKFYVVGLTWMDNMRDHRSPEYMQIKQVVETTFSDLGGNLRTLELAKNSNCVEFFVEWNAEATASILDVMSRLKSNGVQVMEQTYQIRTKPCLPTDVDTCPVLPPSIVGNCEEMCSEEQPCPEGSKCCSNGCGHTCVKVGYAVKVWSIILLNIGGLDLSILDLNSPNILTLASEPARVMIQRNFPSGLVVDVEVTQLAPYMQDGKALGAAHIVMYLSTDAPNDQLKAGKESLLMDSYNYTGIIVSAEAMYLGINSVEDIENPQPQCMRDMPCGGICKELMSGRRYCSCDIGYTGLDCSTWDCRKGFNQSLVIEDSLCMNGARCELDRGDMRYHCTCQSGYIGHLCEMRACDLFDNPCSFYGTCDFNLARAQVCRCNDNRGGLLCEESISAQNEDLTSCERERRMMMFVHEQLKAGGIPQGLTVSMQQFLSYMDDGTYAVPYCWPRDDTHNGEYHSMCMYDSQTGRQIGNCICLNSFREPNGWHYLGEGDCRVYIRPLVRVTEMFYIMNTSWSEGMMDPESELYMEVKKQIKEAINPDNGYLSHVNFRDSRGCVEVMMQLQVQDVNMAKESIMRLLETGITLNGEKKVLSHEMCGTVSLCDFVKEGACGEGRCIGDLNDYRFCSCPSNRGGLFCQKSAPEQKMSLCERHREMTQYALNVLKREMLNDKLTVSMPEFLRKIYPIEEPLGVPKCWPNDNSHYGAYHSFCNYDISTGTELWCYCVNDKGVPNHYNYDKASGACMVTGNVGCEQFPCGNNGECENMRDGGYMCMCHEGYIGKNCETIIPGRCPLGRPLMTDEGPYTCRTQSCPAGFQCIAERGDRWTHCCVDPNFLCRHNLCQAGGTCKFDLMAPKGICDCPPGRTGLLCESEDDGSVRLTECQLQQQFYDKVIESLSTANPLFNITLGDLRTLLDYAQIEYIPSRLCDESGQYKTTVQAVYVRNTNAVPVTICMDRNGMYDEKCTAATCDILSFDGNGDFCQNKGRCVGDVNGQLCDCEGTGFHGVRCELRGESSTETTCTHWRDTSLLAMGILNGSVTFSPGPPMIVDAVKQILELHYSDGFFVPVCDKNGRYEEKGCWHEAEDVSRKMCFCADEDGERFGEEENPLQPPDKCGRGGHEDCPEAWGKSCKQPEWWCSEEVQCNPTAEKCSFMYDCDTDDCFQCVPKNELLSCDPRPCEDDRFHLCDPCSGHGRCANYASGTGHMCFCNTGWEGVRCQKNTEICRFFSKSMCEHGCVGDVNTGELCKCPPGFGGIACTKPVRSPCEKQKALYDQAFEILDGKMTIPGYDSSEVKNLIKMILNISKTEMIPKLECNADGMYKKVQCAVYVEALDKSECYCVDHRGNYLNSNTEPYIDFDVCTAPNDPREFAASCILDIINDGKPVEVCMNGGTCTFTLYDGKICECPSGYHGLFCEKEVMTEDEPESLCELWAAAWDYAHDLHLQNITYTPEIYLRKNITHSILKTSSNRRFAPKAECQEGGEFKPAVCYYDLMTGDESDCYCWGFDKITDTQVSSADDLQGCVDMTCSERESCPNLECEHGYQEDHRQCQICACQNPCETMMCEEGERCVLAKTRCKVHGRDDDEEYEEYDDYAGYLGCTKAVCRPVQKSGSCPGDEATLHSSIIGGVLQSTPRDESNCEAQCYDDADCGGKQKCCGFCGRKCVDAESTFSCQDAQRKAREHLMNIKKGHEKRQEYDLSVADRRLIERLVRIESIWMPTCNDRDGYFFKPVQCEYSIKEAGTSSATPLFCFCVDRLGERIPGAMANSSRADSCTVKPFSCPFVEPKLDDSMEMVKCEADLDCRGGDKCCGTGASKVCTAPFNKQKLSTLVDMLMMNLCEESAALCQGNSQCVGNWEEDGEACQCPSGRSGPFCEVLESKSQTVCQKKQFAIRKFADHLNGNGPSQMGIVSLITQYYMKKIESEVLAFDIQKEPVTMVWYRCMDDGKFEPMQCIVDIRVSQDGSMPTHCFCVDENGMEIVGTRTPASNGQRPFCGGTVRTCPRGYAYHKPDGQKAECDDSSHCPMGYACQRSGYGELACCATSEVLGDKCKMPMDVGRECDDVEIQNYFYYDHEGKACKEFIFRGCEGNGNRFSSMAECSAQCVEKTGPKEPEHMCQIPMRDEDFCGDRVERYFYNTTSKMCEKYIFNGCYPGPDSFDSLEECCGACNKQGRCKMGKCPKIRLGIVGTCATECSSDTECPGKKICCSNGCANVCMVPDAEEESSCRSELQEVRQRAALIRSECEDIYFPRCARDGSWSRQQCKDTQGICWCVTPNGNYINGTMTRGLAHCERVSATMMMMADEYKTDFASENIQVCLDDQEFYCCTQQLCDRKCAAYPNAVCRINPCGGCKAEFYYDGAMVDCDKDLSECANELKTVANAMQERRINVAKAGGQMMDDKYDTDDYRELLNAKLASRPQSVRTDLPGRCQLPPETGLCKGFMRQWYFDPASGVCDMFIWGMCGGNDNRFSSPEECYTACHPTSSPCYNNSCSGNTPDCHLEYYKDCYTHGGYCELSPVCTESPETPMLRDYFVPRCAASGEYSVKQCHADFCGCVNTEGDFLSGLVKGQPDVECTPNGFGSDAALFKCPDNQSPQPECLRACNDKKCLGNPIATCIVDLCSSDCKTKFVDASGAEVQCSVEVKPEDKCEIFTFDDEELDQCEAKKPCSGNRVKTCDPSVCLGASEGCKNPCAVCLVDPCTCKPYFVHASTEERLSEKACQFLSYGNCEVKRCSIMSERVKANLNNIELASEDAVLPECDEAGRFQPKQCMGSKCMCVDEFGMPTNETAEGNSCKEVEKIKRITATFTFSNDFDDLEGRGLLKRLKEEILNKLVELGIDPVIITVGEPYKGSVKVPVTFEEKPDATTKDMSVVSNVVEQMENSGNFDIKIEQESLILVEVDKKAKTASQIQEENNAQNSTQEPDTHDDKDSTQAPRVDDDDDDDGLDTTEKVIIGVVVSIVGLLVIGIIVYCVCCRQRKGQDDSIDNEFQHERIPDYSKPTPKFENYAYEPEGHVIKERL